MNFLSDKKILLASKSPRRKQLLKDTGFSFTVIKGKEVDESIPEKITGKDVAIFLADLKADAYTNEIKENTILITADTIVCLNDKILGKPKDYEDAFNILQSLSGKEHKVITGVSVRSAEKQISFADETSVKFKDLSKEEIDYYITNYKPYDKAGAYGIQEWIGYIGITEIKGSYFNVMGLPVQKIYEILKKFA
ncbi:MAG: Maf family nucleotide pyrophosphatase [Bacteroidales bacterium]|nr:Maf family nucleotide pyrophosphatase [Bacteroidales bacterium]